MPQQSFSLETVSKFDLTLQMDEGAQACAGRFNYATALFERHTIEQMVRHYEHLLEHMAQSLSQRVGELSVLSSEERDQILVQFNETDQALGEPQTLVQSFEAQVRTRPEQTALVDEQGSLSYRDLNAQAQSTRSTPARGLPTGDGQPPVSRHPDCVVVRAWHSDGGKPARGPQGGRGVCPH